MTPSPAQPHPADEDTRLVLAVQGGDLQAFELLMARHADALHAFVALKLPLPHLIDEITHETLVFAFHHLREFTPGTSFRAWLRAIAFNRVRTEVERHLREERNRLAYAERRALEEALADGGADAPRELEALHECLNQLPAHLHELVRSRYHGEESSDSIASRLDRSVAWVRTTLCRVRQQLRECIERKLKAQAS
jgi:RNA polymerase sigma-70 factor (ECF subfamily)